MGWIERAVAVITDFTGKEAEYADRFSYLRQNLAPPPDDADADDETDPHPPVAPAGLAK